MEEELTEFAKAVRRLYHNSEDGRFVIDELQKKYVNKRYMDYIGAGVDVGAFLAYREGQKDVALWLMDCVNTQTGEEKNDK